MTSQLNVDTIVDKAGSGGSNVKMANTSTYVSDGGNVTQNTVQGLTKAWAFTTADGQTINDSFNVSTLVDNGVGIYTIEYTNNMNNALYSGSMAAESQSEGNTQWMENIATTGIQARHYTGSGYYDIPTMWQINGDLA